jgi:hypothetical protein
MLILKIKTKGLFLDIPGVKTTRTPAEIDITKCNLAVVTAYLRKNGIDDFEIISGNKTQEIQKQQPNIIKKNDIDNRFNKLENLIVKLIEKDEDKRTKNPEQITDKLETLEKLIREKPVISRNDVLNNRDLTNDEPIIEELTSDNDTFIPEIDVSNMKLKGASNKTIKQDNSDIDDSADLLSRIMGNED